MTDLRRNQALSGTLLAVVLFLCSGLPAPAQSQDLQVTATVSNDTVGVQDQFELSITITGGESGQAQTPKLPRFQGFRVVAGPSLSSQFQWVNGRSTSSKSFIYTLLPEKEGQYTLDPVEVTVGARSYRTQPIAVRVTSASRRSPAPSRSLPANPLNDDPGALSRTQPSAVDVYVIAEIDRASAYPGQQVTLTYHLYTLINVTGLQLQENPPLTGFWVENLEVESKPAGTRRIINGREYLDYEIKKQALFANTPGRLRIPSSTFAVSVRTAGDFFGIFGQSETVYRKTKEIALDVKPLPTQNRPADFNNAVGSFAITSELSKSEAQTGDAVALRIKLAGMGNLKEIPDLPVPPMPDLAIYSSKREDNLHAVAGDQIGGEKVWEYVIVPKAPGAHFIPALSFSFFDPERDAYQTVTTATIPLKVTRGSDTGTTIAGLSGISKQNLTRQGTDINFIKLSDQELAPPQAPFYYSPWFYIAAVISVLFNVGTFLVQREQARQSGNVVLARSRKARRAALKRLRGAEKSGRLEPRRFYDEAYYSLAGYLGDKLNLPGIAVTADTLERCLLEKSIDPGTVKEIVATLQECDFGRFVSASPAPERKKDLACRIRGVIHALEQSGL